MNGAWPDSPLEVVELNAHDGGHDFPGLLNNRFSKMEFKAAVDVVRQSPLFKCAEPTLMWEKPFVSGGVLAGLSLVWVAPYYFERSVVSLLLQLSTYVLLLTLVYKCVQDPLYVSSVFHREEKSLNPAFAAPEAGIAKAKYYLHAVLRWYNFYVSFGATVGLYLLSCLTSLFSLWSLSYFTGVAFLCFVPFKKHAYPYMKPHVRRANKQLQAQIKKIQELLPRNTKSD